MMKNMVTLTHQFPFSVWLLRIPEGEAGGLLGDLFFLVPVGGTGSSLSDP